MRERKYFFDLNDLQFKQIRLPIKKKLLRLIFWLAGSVAVTIFYGSVFNHIFGSPKERMLEQEVENLKFEYKMANRELDNSLSEINKLKMSDEIRYRPVLSMDSLPESFRNPGFGGVDRFSDLDGYSTSGLMKSTRFRIEEMKNMVSVQSESFNTIKERSAEWKYEMDHLPAISPVDPKFRLGDGFGFREKHPVLGTPQWHYGQDFEVPYGTRVYATGDGKVVESGYNNGLVSIYGHLSKINVPNGVNVKRGDLIGLSGSTGTSSGPHLHYQINKSGKHVNAINYFNNDMTDEEFNEMIQAFESKSKFR
jgi:murein DD-endopeptidase MepM/ murein hydrolase activator NlpD